MNEISGINYYRFFIGIHKNVFSPKLDNVQLNATVRVVWYFLSECDCLMLIIAIIEWWIEVLILFNDLNECLLLMIACTT